jgi:probable F420-dependent oxidoreductase
LIAIIRGTSDHNDFRQLIQLLDNDLHTRYGTLQAMYDQYNVKELFMKIGVVFPQGEIGADPIAVKDFAQAVEALGYDYLLFYELVIDTKSDNPPAAWLEPFTLLSYLAGCTQKIELAAGVVVLPSRQTVLVAKQAAAVDVFSGGRLRLGVSVGWNQVEYQAMGADFHRRGKRLEEQITMLRELWTKPFVTFKGQYHTLDNVGIYPQPVQRLIPIWLGGYTDPVLKRIAYFGDGWLAEGETLETAAAKVDKLHHYLEAAGRKPEEVGLDIVGVNITKPDNWGKIIQGWRDFGATHLDVLTREAGLGTPQAHIDLIHRFKTEIGL